MIHLILNFIFIEDLPENWNHVTDIQSLRSLDRSFLFPGKIISFVKYTNLSVGMHDLVCQHGKLIGPNLYL